MWLTVGHERAVEALARNVADERASHAYLLIGPPNVGKRRLAVDLAKALNCTGVDPPCGECRACMRIESSQHSDVEVVSLGGVCDEADHDHHRDGSKDIKICQVRRVQRSIALRPFEGRMRVVIIDPAESLNVFASDALLKTVEEPPEQVTLVLLANEAASLSETLVSRARQIAMPPVAAAVVREVLAARGTEAEVADLLARLSAGRIGWAISHTQDQSLLEERAQRLDRLEALTGEGRTGRMAFAAELAGQFATNREATYDWLELWRSWFRDLLLVAEGCEDLITNFDRLPAIKERSRTTTTAAIVRAIEALRDCRRQLEENANARLALEVLALCLPSPVRREEAGR
jgi:DNA polymerase-3 subunit delta'